MNGSVKQTDSDKWRTAAVLVQLSDMKRSAKESIGLMRVSTVRVPKLIMWKTQTKKQNIESEHPTISYTAHIVQGHIGPGAISR